MKQLKVEFDKSEPDVERVREIAKDHIRQRASDEELEVLVDKVIQFYTTLDPEQQAELNEKFADRLERHL